MCFSFLVIFALRKDSSVTLQFNTIDGKVDRRSHTGDYAIADGVPRYFSRNSTEQTVKLRWKSMENILLWLPKTTFSLTLLYWMLCNGTKLKLHWQWGSVFFFFFKHGQFAGLIQSTLILWLSAHCLVHAWCNLQSFDVLQLSCNYLAWPLMVNSRVLSLYRNPVGRTGMIGRGLLGRWGPNHAGGSHCHKVRLFVACDC